MNSESTAVQTDRFTCFFRQYSAPYIDFDFCLTPEGENEEGAEYRVHLHLDTSDNSFGYGDVNYAADRDDWFNDHAFSTSEIEYFRDHLVNDEVARQLAARIAELVNENKGHYAHLQNIELPSQESLLKLLNSRVFAAVHCPKM